MRAFLAGLLFLLAAAILAGIGFLLFPFLLVLGWVLRVILIVILLILAIWLLGKFILFVWRRMR
jgi:hypothetical protein